MSDIKNIAVIGAGVMGAAIAAHAANAGADVVLLDVVPGAAEGAIAKMLKTNPAPFMHKRLAKRITPGTTADHMHLLGESDWIIEAVIENLEIKRELYENIDRLRKEGSIVSSNTSTLPLSVLTATMQESFRRDFLITHFFNPPRYMRLLEVVTGPDTALGAAARVTDFADNRMGKSVVVCRDTPGFIANRIGAYWLQCAVTEALDTGMDIEAADAVLGRPAGVPKTGVFGLIDLVGLDLMPHILSSLRGSLPKDDPFHAVDREPQRIKEMIEDGYTGRKGKGGFYRLDREGGKKEKQAIDLKTGDYHPARRPRIAAVEAARKGGLRALLTHDSAESRYAWSVLSRTLSYAALLAEDIAGDVDSVDRAMRLGYNWKRGPFELIDEMGAAWFAGKLAQDGLPVPPLLNAVGAGAFHRVRDGRLQQFTADGYVDVERPDGVLLLSDIKRGSDPIDRNRSASLWDIGDGVMCLEFHSKMNSLNPLVLAMVDRAVELVPGRGFKALVIHNEAEHFSVGANIMLLLIGAKLRLWPFIRWMLKRGQDTFKAMKHAPFPVVGAPSGMALGGGCEVLLHCDAIQAHAETYAGLVEAGVGIVPGWGGCKEMLARWSKAEDCPGGPMPPVLKSFETIAMAQVSTSAVEAKDLKFLRSGDAITMNRDRVLFDAKAKALELTRGYTPPEPVELQLPGATGRAALAIGVRDFVNKGVASPHDAVIAGELARVLSGGDTDMTETVDADRILALERDAIVQLCKTPESRERISHMLKTGKPLRN